MAEKELLSRKVFYAGDVVFREGDEGNFAYLVESGAIEIFKTMEGERVSLSTFSKGEIFGEMALVDNSARMASAMAVEETGVVVITRVMFEKRLRPSDKFVKGLIRVLVTNLRNVHQSYMRRARSVDDHLAAIDFFLGGLRKYMNIPNAEEVKADATKQLERMDEALQELKTVFKDHVDKRESVLSKSDTTGQGKPDPIEADVSDLVG